METPEKHPAYWKVKAALLQRQLTLAELRAAAADSADLFNQAMRDVGLDPTKQYEMLDADETITLKP